MSNFNYSIRDYNETDYQFIYDVKKIVYRKYVEMNWGEWNEEKQIEMFKSFINDHAKDIKIVMVDDKRVGFYHGNDLDESTYEQRNICLIPEFQGKGIGSNILKYLIETHKSKDICLRCFKQNPVINLYKRLGFKIVSETDYHYLMKLNRK